MRSLIVLACMGLASTANAIPLIYEFTGSGNLCTYLGVGYASSCAQQEFTGVVRIDVDPTAPHGIDYDQDGIPIIADDRSGTWVRPDITINWNASTFNPAPYSGPGATSSYYSFVVDFAPGYPYYTNEGDYVYTSESHSMPLGAGHINRGAALYRHTLNNDRTWVTSVDWPLLLELGPGLNRIGFWNTLATPNSAGDFDYLGFFTDRITLSSLTLQNRAEVMALTVPEPATLGLFALGLLGMGASRRRRT